MTVGKVYSFTAKSQVYSFLCVFMGGLNWRANQPYNNLCKNDKDVTK